MLEFTRLGAQEIWVAGSVASFLLIAFVMILLRFKIPAILVASFLAMIIWLVSGGYLLFQQENSITKGHPVNEVEYLSKVTKPGAVMYGFKAMGANWAAYVDGKKVVVKSLQPVILVPYLEGHEIAKAAAKAISGDFKPIHEIERFRGAFNSAASKSVYNWVEMRTLPTKDVKLKSLDFYVPTPNLQNRLIQKLWPETGPVVPKYWQMNPMAGYAYLEPENYKTGIF